MAGEEEEGKYHSNGGADGDKDGGETMIGTNEDNEMREENQVW